VTTEHFTLQDAGPSTIAEGVEGDDCSLTTVSGGLAEIGLVATAAHVGTAT
jgi:hypothetical protein